MTEAGDYILVYFLEAQSVGTRFLKKRHDWPLHITLLPWFHVSDEHLLQVQLNALAAETPLHTATLGQDASFGAATHVTLIAQPEFLRSLQEALLDRVRDLGGQVRSEQYVGSQYMPHVTHHDNQPIPLAGEPLAIRHVSLVRLLQHNTCEIISHFQLGAHHEATA